MSGGARGQAPAAGPRALSPISGTGARFHADGTCESLQGDVSTVL